MPQRSPEFLFDMYRRSGDGNLIPPRFHKIEYELCEVTSGRISARIGTLPVEAEAGDILFVPKGSVFSLSANGAASVRGVIFDSHLVEADMVRFDTEVLYMFSVRAENNNAVFPKDSPESAGLHRALEELSGEYEAKDVCFRLPLRAWLLLLMTDLLRYFCGSKNEQDRMVYHNVLRLRPVIGYIAEHLPEKMRIEDFAGMIGVSADYFTKMFKESIGKTPIDYVNALRVNRSMQLLIGSELSVSEISDQLGFSAAAYYNKIFKQYVGLNPTAYRKEASEQSAAASSQARDL